jgi:hypothetical protein
VDHNVSVSDEHDEEQRRYEEALKLCHDGCKHLSALSAVAAGILVAIYREDVIDSTPLAIALIMLALSIIASLMGLLSSTTKFITGGEPVLPFVVLFFSVVFLAMGMAQVVAEVLHLPSLAAFVVGFLVGVALTAPVIVPLFFPTQAQRRGRTR